MKKFLIRILFNLLNPPSYADVKEDFILRWLLSQYQDMGFREYFKKRDLQLLKAMGAGVTRDNYLILLGQRLEVLGLLQRVEETWKKDQKEILIQKARKAEDN